MIVEIINKYINLSKKGRSYVGICPFHQDTRPSLHVNDDKNCYKCFACGASGGMANFIKEVEKISISKARLKVNKLMSKQIYNEFFNDKN